jgi:hypothetical protein
LPSLCELRRTRLLVRPIAATIAWQQKCCSQDRAVRFPADPKVRPLEPPQEVLALLVEPVPVTGQVVVVMALMLPVQPVLWSPCRTPTYHYAPFSRKKKKVKKRTKTLAPESTSP